MRKIFLALFFMSICYLVTGVVYEEGGFGVSLIVKPAPSFQFYFGGGEEGAWARDNPHQQTPWWQCQDQIKVLSGDWEDERPYWVAVHFWGLMLLILAWPAFLLLYFFRLVQRCLGFYTNQR